MKIFTTGFLLEMSLKEFQHDLNKDKETKQNFVNASDEHDEDSESSDESSDEDSHIKIVSRKAKKKYSFESDLMERLVSQQKAYVKAQKTIFKLRSENEIEEVKMRYLKLDLNNAQVLLDEEKELTKKLKKDLNLCLPFLSFFLLYILIRMVMYF